MVFTASPKISARLTENDIYNRQRGDLYVSSIVMLQTVEIMRGHLPQHNITTNDTLPFEKDPENAIEQAKVNTNWFRVLIQ